MKLKKPQDFDKDFEEMQIEKEHLMSIFFNEEHDSQYEFEKSMFHAIEKQKDLRTSLPDTVDEEYEKVTINHTLTQLYQMLIVNLYMGVENGLKYYVELAYKIETKEFYKWNSITTFFKEKGINLLEKYPEINELRIVNNNIKHSWELNNNVKKIREFNNMDYFSHVKLKEFYERVKSKVPDFLNYTANHVINERYSFSDERLQKMADMLAGRMEPETMTKYAEILKEKAEPK